MAPEQNRDNQRSSTNLVCGLPAFIASDPQAIAKEKAELTALEQKGLLRRWRGYFRMTGPGWMQSAMTLGGGSAMASLFAGAMLQYKLLWVQPLAMLLGVIMLSAMSYQTLSTGARPFHALRKFVHPSLAWVWVIITLLSTIIWHLPQYALAVGMSDDIIKAITHWQPSSGQQTLLMVFLGTVFLAVSIAITWRYSGGRKGVRIYERTLKAMVWMIVLAFALVVFRRSLGRHIEWTSVLKGFLPLHIPTSPREVSVVMAGFGAAIGINMTFLFPYTLLARGWSKEHRALSRFDLITGMFLPYCLATALMIIATGCTIYDPEMLASGSTMLSPARAAVMLEAAGLGTFFSRIVFSLGILGMVLSTITMQMLVCGFAACEAFGLEPGGWHHKLACLLPAPAVVGVLFWRHMGPWVAVPTTAICGLLLPVAYAAFFILNNSKKYLGQDKPIGAKALIWNIGMLAAIIVSAASSCYYLYTHFCADIF
ncbi:MAG: divalent metal cation transporter [Planctomycetota bacterium]|nr:MAG: divalent metal cation transporter [Planctomycetota bacterium]